MGDGDGDLERVSIDEVRDGLRAQEVAQLVHDLKSPLATIALESELLGFRVSERSSRAAVQRILLNVGFIDRMVLDLLDLCVIDCGRLELRRAPTELREHVDDVVERVIPTSQRHRVFVDATTPAVLELDSLRIERVLANLLQNAFKYAPRVRRDRPARRRARPRVRSGHRCRPRDIDSRNGPDLRQAPPQRCGIGARRLRARAVRQQADRRSAPRPDRRGERARRGIALLLRVADELSNAHVRRAAITRSIPAMRPSRSIGLPRWRS